ncbi:MAG: penicillin-binding protein 1C, partial [Myxococcales bacterium]|nr:penicillin-binding protein 1C [Myxococcales bacterium]
HASRWLADRHPGADRVPTTLDRGVQGAAERALARFTPEARELGIHNAVVVVVDHENGAVRGLVGNMDFWDAEHGGQIPAFDVPRSPGSTLKPFVYGVAIDRGLELPEHLVADVPVAWGTWSPDNYDGRFSGMVRLEDALSRSLNVPFVNLLDRVGVEPFLGVMRQSGVTSIAPEPGHYGLSLVAGGIELTPLELTTMYTALAEDGVPRALRFSPEDPVRELAPTMSPGSAWLVRRALTRRDRPDFPGGQGGAEPHHIHWKTGTSYGHRDAWAVGSGERYTVAVWLGNMDNRASVRLVGAAAAGPVLFDVFDALGDRGPEQDLPTDDLEPIEVCALTGERPGPACTHTDHALALRSASPTHRCEVHATIEVDVDTGERVLPGCRAGRQTEERQAVVWAPEVRRYLDDPGQPLPRLAEACADLGRSDRPRIVEPRPELVRVLVPGMAAEEQEVALEADAPPGPLDWFVDGRHLGRAAADEVVWWTPSAGKHLVVVQDRAGNTDRQWIEVRSL